MRLPNGITNVILWVMKTAISIPDALFEMAEKLAARLGVSRSELYRNALAEFVSRNNDRDVTEQLDAIYGTDDTLGPLDEELSEMQEKSLSNAGW